MVRCGMVAATMAGAAFLVATIAGCGSSAPSYTLIKAAYTTCGAQGDALASYLATGKPASDDLAYGSQREAVLGMSAAQQPVAISQAGDQLIQRCDQQVTAQRQAQAQQARAAAAQARAARAARRLAAANHAAGAMASADCRRFGGQWEVPTGEGPEDGDCGDVSYLGTDGQTYYVNIDFAASGAIEPPGNGTGSATQSECDRGYYPDGSAGPVNARPGTWSALLGICLVPAS